MDVLPASFTTAQAKLLGVERWRLYELRNQAALIPISRGVWRRADAPTIAHESLLAVSLRVPRGTVCLQSALEFHELTDEFTTDVHLAIPRGFSLPSITYPPVAVHVFDAATFDLGRERIEVAPGEYVAIYDPVRSVVDAVRLRHLVGTDIAYRATRELLNQRRGATAELIDMSKQLGCAGPVLDLLEVLQA